MCCTSLLKGTSPCLFISLKTSWTSTLLTSNLGHHFTGLSTLDQNILKSLYLLYPRSTWRLRMTTDSPHSILRSRVLNNSNRLGPSAHSSLRVLTEMLQTTKIESLLNLSALRYLISLDKSCEIFW